MEKYKSEILERISENEISRQLLMEYFDGVVLVDAASDRIIPISDFLSGKLKQYINFETGTYSENINVFIDLLIPEDNRAFLRKNFSLENVRQQLEYQKSYNVDFHVISPLENKVIYKRFCYRYIDSAKDIIVLICEDTSDIVLNDIDPLTGLYDSTGFHKRIREWIKNNPGRKYRIQRYNIDHFKDINGIYGYAMGNKLLRDCGYHMKQNDTPDSFSAHLNADHFARFCSDDSATAREYYDSFVQSFGEYDLKLPISIHMGVYDLCEPHCNSYTMAYKALLALQLSKGKFNSPIVYYEKGMMDVEMEQQEFLNDVDKAIENDEFEVWFQPQINYKTGDLIGAEALIRWRHPQKGLITPGLFVPVFENSARISDVDKHMIIKTCAYMRRWMSLMPEKPIIVSVNLSRLDIQRPDFAKRLKALVESYGIPAGNMRLEITENAYMEDSETIISTVKNLKDEGFIIEMDDFGSGYSSLNILKDIDIDILKLDMNFLAGEKNTEKSKVIISSVISMASALGLPVIAEGVETKEQSDMLLGFGCEQMQGYYFSKPIPAEEYENMLLEA